MFQWYDIVLRSKKEEDMEFRKAIRSKLKNRQGFSLSELLVATIIVTLISMMIATGTNTAVRAYDKVTEEANAEVLLSTCASMLRNELTTSKEITVSEDKKSISYKKTDTGYYATIRSGVASGGSTETAVPKIWITEYGTTEKQWISDITATNGLIVSFETIDYSDGVVTVTGLAVRKKGKNGNLAYLPSLVIENI